MQEKTNSRQGEEIGGEENVLTVCQVLTTPKQPLSASRHGTQDSEYFVQMDGWPLRYEVANEILFELAKQIVSSLIF